MQYHSFRFLFLREMREKYKIENELKNFSKIIKMQMRFGSHQKGMTKFKLIFKC